MVAALNARSQQEGGGPAVAVAIPLDGFHLYRSQLAQMADREEAFARRGAAFTFDADGWLALVRGLRGAIGGDGAREREEEGEEGVVWAPSFDHAAKDPVPRAIRIGPAQRVVVLEGNYVLLQSPAASSAEGTSPAWSQAAALLDERWFVAVDEAAAARRLVARHVAAGIVASEAEAWGRVRGSDLLNGREIVRCRGKVDEEVVSKEDPGWG